MKALPIKIVTFYGLYVAQPNDMYRFTNEYFYTLSRHYYLNSYLNVTEFPSRYFICV